MMQKLNLKIDKVHLLKCAGRDQLTLHVVCPEMLNKITKGHLTPSDISYTDLFGNSLYLVIDITRNCGEKLAEELGLNIEEITKV